MHVRKVTHLNTTHACPRSWRFLIIIGLWALLLNPVYSVVVDRFPARHWVHDAELIVVGEITDLYYRNSEATNQSPNGIPHTFVTLDPLEVLKGEPESTPVRFRMQGGVNEFIETDEETGFSYMEMSGVPRLDVGDTGVFFIKRHEDRVCPLVGWRRGFVRFIDGQAITDTGTRLLHVDNPYYPARIHPDDLVNPRELAAQMLDGDGALGEAARQMFSEVTRALIQNPEALSSFSLEELELSVPPQAPRAAVHTDPQLMPSSFKRAADSPMALYLAWDLNWILSRPDLFDGENREFSPEVMLNNRRALEEIYPEHVKNSPDQTIVRGEQLVLDAIMEQNIAGHTMSHRLSEREKAEEENESENEAQLPEGQELSSEEFVALIQEYVDSLLTPAEREEIPVFENADIEGSFTAPQLNVAEMRSQLPPAEKQEPQSLSEQRETEQLREREGNPVLSPQE